MAGALPRRGPRVVEIDDPPATATGSGTRERTLAAMRAGADVIYQGVFVDDGWHGISDFLVRVDAPSARSAPGATKRGTPSSRVSSKPYFILQLCFYSEQLARLQGSEPAQMHVILGTGESGSLPLPRLRRLLPRRAPALPRRGRERTADLSVSRLALRPV